MSDAYWNGRRDGKEGRHNPPVNVFSDENSEYLRGLSDGWEDRKFAEEGKIRDERRRKYIDDLYHKIQSQKPEDRDPAEVKELSEYNKEQDKESTKELVLRLLWLAGVGIGIYVIYLWISSIGSHFR